MYLQTIKILIYTWKKEDIKARKVMLWGNLRKFVSLICPKIVNFSKVVVQPGAIFDSQI